MQRHTILLILLGLITATQAGAADEPAKKQKGSGTIERTVEKSGAALGRTADKVEKKVRKGAAATAKAIDTAGKKTGQWLKEKTKTD